MGKIFFATAVDVVRVWRWLFDAPGMKLFEEYSVPDRANRWFDAWEDVETYLGTGGYSLAAWPETVGGRPCAERVTFEREAQREFGAKGRTILRGPAIININRNNDQNGCLASTWMNFWTEKGVSERSIYPEVAIEDVDWALFRSVVGKVQREVMTASPAKLHSYPIMPDAFEQLRAGRIKLWNWGEAITCSSPLLAIK